MIPKEIIQIIWILQDFEENKGNVKIFFGKSRFSHNLKGLIKPVKTTLITFVRIRTAVLIDDSTFSSFTSQTFRRAPHLWR